MNPGPQVFSVCHAHGRPLVDVHHADAFPRHVEVGNRPRALRAPDKGGVREVYVRDGEDDIQV
ncbi:MAG: hypothetical protein LBJ15_16490, partial [Comamonas sp.]|nr:hypothetical protein [Comamonas sp.]